MTELKFLGEFSLLKTLHFYYVKAANQMLLFSNPVWWPLTLGFANRDVIRWLDHIHTHSEDSALPGGMWLTPDGFRSSSGCSLLGSPSVGDREKPFQLRNAEDQGSVSHQDIVLQLCTQITYATYGPLPGKMLYFEANDSGIDINSLS